MIYPRVRFLLWFINDKCTAFKSFLMVYSHRATVYLWSLHFLFSDVQNGRVTQPPVQLEPPPRLLIAPMALLQEVINSSHYSFDTQKKKTQQFQRQADPRAETNGNVTARAFASTQLHKLHLQTLITSRLQSKQLIASARRTHYWPNVFQAFLPISSVPPHSWLHFAPKHFRRHPASTFVSTAC